MANRMDKVGKILFHYGVSTHTKKPLNIEKCARQICQLIPQPLDDKEFDEAIAEVLRKNMGVRVVDTIHGGEKEYFFPDMVAQFRALLQPKIEEVRRQERERMDIIAFLEQVKGGMTVLSLNDEEDIKAQWRALKGGE